MKVMDNSRWTSLHEKPFANGINWDGGEPVPDINTDRKLFIKKSSKKLGVGKGSYKRGFLCEFKKKGTKNSKYILIQGLFLLTENLVLITFVACKDNTWVLDEESEPNNRRCLKLFTEKKNWLDAYNHCEAEGSNLVKLAPRATQKLKGILKENRFILLFIWGIFFVKKI